MAVYNIKILGSDGTATSQPIGSSSEHILIQNEGNTNLTTKLTNIATSISNLTNSLNGKANATVATTSSNGLMSSTDKAKLDKIDPEANKYVLPTASTTLGGVKTTSSVASASGYTACPIVGGVVYYKEASLSGLGISATAAELNKIDGLTTDATHLNYCSTLTGNVQSQLDGKAPSTHSQSANTIGEGTFASTKIYAANGDDSTSYRVRNLTFTNSDPGAGATDSHNGSLICVYE